MPSMDVEMLARLALAHRNMASKDTMNDLLAFLRPHVYRIAFNLVYRRKWNDGATECIADDLTNEALLRFIKNFHKLDEMDRIIAWFRVIMGRMITDEFRSTRNHPHLVPLTETTPETKGGSIDTTGGAELRMTLLDALRALSKEHREVLILVYLEQYTVPEAAEKLGIPVGTAKSRVYYALRSIRRVMRRKHTERDLYALAAA